MPERRAEYFKSFTSSTRNRILVALARKGEISVDALARQLRVTEPTISRHLHLLRTHGVVRRRREGALHFYSLDESAIVGRVRDFLAFLGIEVDILPRKKGPGGGTATLR
jgi:ArsR family transcriptional regulator